MANHFGGRKGSLKNLRLLILLLSGLLAASQSFCSTTQSVILGWNPSPSPNVVAYNIYYGGTMGDYTNMVSVGNVTNATISGLVNGATYYFAGTTVNSSGLQSALSGQTSYTVPELDTTKPWLSITNATSGMQVNTAAFTVMGLATDNVAVATVYYSLNGALFATATTANQWTNWSAALTLVVGTNTFAAYAADTSGNLSTTDTVTLDRVVTAPLAVQTNGQGSINPNYNGSPLQIGGTYSMTATAANGFMFTDWTGGTSGTFTLYTNGPTVQFIMITNLVLRANFVDTNRPTLVITNVTSGMVVSNGTFTVRGWATNNVAVPNVYYLLNNGGWSNAVFAASLTNWSAVLSLDAGTNTFAAYAEDINGNISATDTVDIVNGVNNPLGVQLKGQGSISPDYSNSWLQAGQNYSIAATPAHGFMVANWVVSTNFIGGVETNNSTVHFKMAPNPTLQVNFKETARPALTIFSPSNGKHTTNAIAKIIGTARDVWKVTQVLYQLNGGDWAPVFTTNGYTNWTSTLQLTAGTNTFRTYALNLGGNCSTTNSISLVSSNTFKMQFGLLSRPSKATALSFNLEISPNLNGEIQVSTNLADWTYLTNFVGTNATTIKIYDPNATNSQRFYRAVIP